MEEVGEASRQLALLVALESGEFVGGLQFSRGKRFFVCLLWHERENYLDGSTAGYQLLSTLHAVKCELIQC